MGPQETIIYRLVMRNHDFHGLKKIWRENGRGRHAGAEGSFVLRPNKKLAHPVELLGEPLSQKLFSKI